MSDLIQLPKMSRVLIVDDEETNLKIWKEALRGMCRLATASSGEEALAIFGNFRPDLIVLDRMMPGMSGDIVLAKIRALDFGGNTKIVMHSALGRVSEQVDGMEKGADLYIPKTVDIAVAVTQVRSLLAMQRHDSSSIVLTALRNLRNETSSQCGYAVDLLMRGVLKHTSLLTDGVIADDLDLVQFVNITSEFYTEQVTSRSVTLVPNLGVTSADILGNSELISSALASMLEYLLKSTPKLSRIYITLNEVGDEYVIQMSSNSGESFTAAERQRMFIFDISTEKSRHHVGTALAWETAVRHGGDLVAMNTAEGHPSFVLTLPSRKEMLRLAASAA